eukprot:gene6974-12596_t
MKSIWFSTAPPSAPNVVRAKQIGSKWILLEWTVPMNQGTGDKLKYMIRASCTKCKIPPDFTTSNRSLNVTGLSAYTRYDVRVYSINNVTAAIGFDKAQYNSTSVLTGSGLPSEVQNLAKRTNSDASVTIFWNEPLTKGGDDLQYFITVNDEKGMFTTKMKYTVKQDLETKKYTVSVSISLTLVIAVVVTLFVLLLIAIAFIVYFYRRGHPKHLQTVRLENGEVILPRGKGVQNFVNLTYQDLEDVVQQFANELDRGWIKLERLIGGGEFGDVYIGTMEKPSEKAQIVAVKTLKSNANKKARDDFLGEAAYMGQFDDPNVIHLEGVVVKDLPILIVMEFMSNGSLDSFLQKNDDKFTPLQLLGMARGVASGMTYLSEKSYIHRDLAARNILVNDDMVCKVADFGMSRELSKDDTYDTTVLKPFKIKYFTDFGHCSRSHIVCLTVDCYLFDRILLPKFLLPCSVILPSGKGVQNFVNLTYQDLEDVVQQFANELDRGWIKLERLIGEGEFGDVYKGTMEKPSEKAQIVAVKTLKSNANKKARDDFLGEAMYMGQFDDPNVIHLEGVVVKDLPILIVMEFMSNGSLQSFLQKNDDQFTPLQLLGMARGVASGMTYLSEKSYIHRDLAARNILVNDDMVCKVADFGMSRELSKEDTYDTTVLERLASGFRLPPPMSCPKVVHDLMLSCWHKDRVKRPKFKDIRGTIDKWIQCPELLTHEKSIVIRRYVAIYLLSIFNKSIKLEYEVNHFGYAIHTRWTLQ